MRDRWQKGGGEQGAGSGGGSSDEAEAEGAITRLAIDDEFRESGGTVSRRVLCVRVRCVTRVQLQRLALERMHHVLRRDNASER